MADNLTVTREGEMLVIRIPIKLPTPSSSGMTLVVASTRCNQKTAVQIDGKEKADCWSDRSEAKLMLTMEQE